MKRATEAGTASALPPIPDALLRILRERWNAASPDYERFEDVWSDSQDRRRHPSFYGCRDGAPFDPSMQPLRFAELVALSRLDEFAGLIHLHDDGRLAQINEHAAHAVEQFAEETYAAWAKLRSRLDTVREAQK